MHNTHRHTQSKTQVSTHLGALFRFNLDGSDFQIKDAILFGSAPRGLTANGKLVGFL